MATLQAIVDIQDKASAKFARMSAAAKVFEERLDKVDRKLREVEARMAALSRMNVSMRVSLDTSAFDAQMAMLLARAKAVGAIDMGSGGDGFAMPNPNMPGFALPRVSDDMDLEEKVAKVVVTDRRKRLNIAQANNGLLGFFLVAGRAALNFRTIIEPLARIIDQGLGPAFSFAQAAAAAFGKTLDVGSTAAVALRGAIATTIAGLGALVAASFLFVQIGTAVAGVLGLIATALTSLAVPLAALTAGIGGLVGVIGFVAIPMFKLISDTKKLVDEKDELNKKIETLDKSSKEYLQTQNRLNEIQKELNKSGFEGVYRQLQGAGDRIGNAVFTPKNTQLFTDIIAKGLEALRPLLPILTKLVTMFATEIAKVADKFVEFTKDPANLALIMNFFEAGARLIQPFADVIGQLGKLFMQLGVAIGPIAEVMLKEFAGYLKNITDYLSTPEGMASLRGFFEKMYPVFRDLLGLLGAFLGGIKDVGVALAPEFQMVIGWLREVGGQFVKWIIETVKKYGPDFARVMKIIGNVIGIIWDVLTKVYDAFKPIIELVLSVVEVIITMVRVGLRLMEIAHIADIIAFAFRLIGAPIMLAVEAVKKLFNWFNDLVTWIAESAVGQAISAAFEGVAEVFGTIAGLLSTIKDTLKWILDHLPSFTKNYSPEQIAAIRDRGVMGGGGNAAGVMTGGGGIPRSPNVEGEGASGAIVTRPTRALIGEAGPEAVVPLHATRGARKLQMGVGSGVQISGDIHVHGVQNLDDFVNEVQKYVSNLPRESGSGMSVG